MSIKTGLHRRLHRKLYYGITNAIIIQVYNASEDEATRAQNVITALGIIRAIVYLLDQQAPY